ncbi:hypothetical protein NCLIV_055120 [Neospora caninum Liverpool]|nr:hypothetical protein NCLIV_055120 [Neospora caninum Liverpool]CBZ55087.1 hypothetical protein NCLIV_055120 [Neospora caninum Liverpool]|eukprot:XP_003885115.1 hypothetical protein NCLIV_055120 [Neospora caninum Liverpool]
MSKVNTDVMKAWVSSKITALLGFEDDIVSSYCMTQLYPEEALSQDADARQNYLCPKKLVISMTGFIGKNALQFVKELWELLIAAQKEKNGIPPAFLENKKLEMERKREEAAKINEELIRRHEQMMKDEFNRQVKDIATGHAQSQPPTVLAAAGANPDSLGLSSSGAGMRGWDAPGGVEPVITVPQGFDRAEEDNEAPVRRRAPSSSRSGSEASDYGRRRRHRDRRFKEHRRRDRSASRSRSRSPSSPRRERSRSRGRDRDRERRRRSLSRERR